MPTLFSKPACLARNKFTEFVNEFVRSYQPSSVEREFYEQLAVEEYNRILREDNREAKKRKTRRSFNREEQIDFSVTNWARFIADPEVNDP